MSYPFKSLHPTGEQKKSKEITENTQSTVDTYAGRLHVEWDPNAAVTPLGQLPFFIEFLKTSKLFDDLVASCPLDLFPNPTHQFHDCKFRLSN